MQTQTVRATRAFYYQRKLVKKGDTVELPKVFAIEMVAANKAEFVESKKPAAETEKGGNGNAR